MLAVGVCVTISAPFNQVYPGTYKVVAQSSTGAWKIGIAEAIEDCPDFDEDFLTVVPCP